ncbi:MAG: hypothetical protein LBH43_06935 [Treponema sp.]|jgi:hypothetical protein|nr:hypothetical protein [Treponema sp.]
MKIDDIPILVGVASGTVTLWGCLPKAIDKVRRFITNSGFEIKTNDEEIDYLKGYLNYKKTKEGKKRCKTILKKHNLPNSVGIMCKSENDICFIPNKTIVYKDMNNLNLKSNDGAANPNIGGGYFALVIENIEAGSVHQRVMNGTVIKHKGEIYLLRHPLGGYPNYLAKLDLFINGMIIELDDGFKVGLKY